MLVQFEAMSTKPHVLVVEDDRKISEMIDQYLSENGMRVTVAGDAPSFDRVFADGQYDMLILDVMLPGENGISICSRVRSASAIPIMFLSARGEDNDRVIGLEVGADDYLVKPFSLRELLARVRAMLRREELARAPAGNPARVLSFAGFDLDMGLRELRNSDGSIVNLTGAEFDLLRVLVERPKRVLTRDNLLDYTQGHTSTALDRSIDILISRLRQKIELDPRDPQIIRTVRGEGYIFAPEVVVR